MSASHHNCDVVCNDPSISVTINHVPHVVQPPPSEQSRLDILWTKHSKRATRHQRYTKTAVLTLHWEDSDLKTKPEVDELAKAFREDYNFIVEDFGIKIASALQNSAQNELNYGLAKFVRDHDAEGVLLIVYYAGHGHAPSEELRGEDKNGSKVEFDLYRKTSKKALDDRKRSSAAWGAAETNLKTATADVLAIFDCCHAGRLSEPRERGFARFEYLGACSADQTTKKPGPYSFTKALIWALKDLKDKAPFTTSELRQTIKEYKDFDKNQFPSIANPFEPSRDHIMLGPISAKDSSSKQVELSEKTNSHAESVDLRFHFSRPINDKTFVQLAETLNVIVSNDFHKAASKDSNRFPVPPRTRNFYGDTLGLLIANHETLHLDSVGFLAKHTQDSMVKNAVSRWRSAVNNKKRSRDSLFTNGQPKDYSPHSFPPSSEILPLDGNPCNFLQQSPLEMSHEESREFDPTQVGRRNSTSNESPPTAVTTEKSVKRASPNSAGPRTKRGRTG